MTHLREPHVPGWLRRRTWLVGVLAILAVMAGAMQAAAQVDPLGVSDFDEGGLETVVLAAFDAGGDITFYAAADSPWGASGRLIEGDVALNEDTSIIRVMLPNSDGSLLRLNDNDGDNAGLVMRDYFGQSGAGVDLTVWVQTSSGTANFPANDIDSAGKNYVNFKVPASERAILTGIGANDRFLLALTRPTPNTPPSFPDGNNDGTADAVARTVAENTNSGNAGAAITATDPDSDTLTYSVAPTSDNDASAQLAAFNRDFSLDAATGQISVKTAATIDYETRPSYKVLLQVTDSKNAAGEAGSAIDDTAVLTITVTNANEAGAVSISGTPEVGGELTATLDDPDGTTSSVSWQWSAAATKKGSYAAISGQAAATYTVAEGEVGNYLRATATYTDTTHNAQSQPASATVGPVEAVTSRGTSTNTPPSFPDGDNDGTADAVARAVAENTNSGNAGAAITATDRDIDTLTYSVAQTSDNDALAQLAAFNRDFSLDAATGQISVKTAATIDYETRPSYKALLQVTDSKDAAGEADSAIDDTAVLTITVTNANEAGAVSISGTPEVGGELTATLDDPDGTASTVSWQWSASADADGPFADFAPATSAEFTVIQGKLGKYLRATATYTDTTHNAQNQTASATVGPVAQGTGGNTAPSFPDSDNDGTADPVSRTVAENTTRGKLGAAVTATDPGDSLTYSVWETSDTHAAAHLAAFKRDFSVRNRDGARFEYGGQIRVRSSAAIDYETRSSYKVVLRATDSGIGGGIFNAGNLHDYVVVTITVTNVNEAGVVSVFGTVETGRTLTASLEDPDGATSSLVWQWATSESRTGPFTDIGSATSAAYTVAEGDADKYLRVTATYADTTHNATGQTATATVGPVEESQAIGQESAHEASTTPLIISASSFTVDEGLVNVGVLAAYDDDTVTADLTWSLSGGDDESHFTLSTMGELAFSAAKDYETPDDDGTDGTYAVTVEVSDGDNESTADIEVTLADVDESSTAPPAPGAPSVTEDGVDALEVKWTAPSHTATITGYDLQYRTVDETEWSDGPQDVNSTKADITGLTKDVNYQVRVRAQDADSAGPWSDYGTGTTALFETAVTAGSVDSTRDGYWGYHNRNRDRYGAMTPDEMSYDGNDYEFTIVATRYCADRIHCSYRVATDVNVKHNILPNDWLVRYGQLRHRVNNALSGQLFEEEPPEWKFYWLERAIDPQLGWNKPFAISRDPATSTHRAGHHRTAENPTGADAEELIAEAATGSELRAELDPEEMVDSKTTPTNLHAETFHDRVVIRWTAPTSTDITGYKIYRGVGDGELVVLVADTGNTNTRYVDYDVEEGSVYRYAVEPIFSSEPGSISNVPRNVVNNNLGEDKSSMSSEVQTRTLVGDPTPRPNLVLPELPRTDEGSLILPVNAVGGKYRHTYATGESQLVQYYSVDLEPHVVYRVSLWALDHPKEHVYYGTEKVVVDHLSDLQSLPVLHTHNGQQLPIWLQQVIVGDRSGDTTVSLRHATSSRASGYLRTIFNGTDGATVSYVFQTESTGEHTLQINGSEPGVLYHIRIEKLADHPDLPSRVHQIPQYRAAGTLKGWNWGAISPGDQDWFAVNLRPNQSYRINLLTNYNWPGLRSPDIVGLAGPDGLTIASTTSATNSLFYTTSPDGGGTHYIGIRSSSAQDIGLYFVEVILVDDPHGAFASRELHLGQTFTGFFHGHDRDGYRVTLQADRKYRILLTAGSVTAGYTTRTNIVGVCNTEGCTGLTDFYKRFSYSEIRETGVVPAGFLPKARMVEFSPKRNGVHIIEVDTSGRGMGTVEGNYLLKVEDIGPE